MFALLQSFKRAYDVRLSVKCLALLLLFGAALLLERIAGGFPPPAWRILAQTVPQLSRLFSARGLAALVPFAGLLVLSATWAALWLLLAWLTLVLLWRAWFPAKRARRQAIQWQRTSLDNLLDSGFDEPQATLAYASAYDTASFDLLASPSTPIPDVPTHPKTHPSRPAQQPRPTSRPPVRVRRGEPLWSPAREDGPPGAAGSTGGRPQGFAPTNTIVLTSLETKKQAEPPRLDVPSAHLAQKVGIGWDAGITRKNKPNEDSVLTLHGACPFRGQLTPLSLYAIADGMGGHASGQIASHLATHSLMQTVLPAIQHGEELTEEFLIDTMVDCAHLANQAVFQYRENHSTDLGTTLTAALVAGSTACVVNVGDSRTYLYRAGEGLRQITRDHSLVARLVATGIISAEEVYTHPERNKVYRAIGEKDEVQVDWFIEPVQPGDALLLCSDGLWELVRDHEIEKILRRCIPDASQAADALVKAALHRGGSDNISVIVALI